MRHIVLLIHVLPRLATEAKAAEPVCVQAGADRAETLHVDSVLSFRGREARRCPDGTFLVVWTGVDCVGWFRLKGNVSVDASWRHIVVPRDGRFVAHEESPRGRLDYTIEPSGDATLSIDGRAVAIDSSTAGWVDAMTREFVRRLGFGAVQRANEILRQQGLRGLIDEVTHIPHADVRAQYLIAGLRAVARLGASLVSSQRVGAARRSVRTDVVPARDRQALGAATPRSSRPRTTKRLAWSPTIWSSSCFVRCRRRGRRRPRSSQRSAG